MSDRKVLPMAETWAAKCPSCEHVHEGFEFVETPAGVFEPDGPDRFIRCDNCDSLFEIAGVRVVEDGE